MTMTADSSHCRWSERNHSSLATPGTDNKGAGQTCVGRCLETGCTSPRSSGTAPHTYKQPHSGPAGRGGSRLQQARRAHHKAQSQGVGWPGSCMDCRLWAGTAGGGGDCRWWAGTAHENGDCRREGAGTRDVAGGRGQGRLQSEQPRKLLAGAPERSLRAEEGTRLRATGGE